MCLIVLNIFAHIAKGKYCWDGRRMSVYFSILVPVYNVEQYVDDCIKSVLRQNYIDYELILVDDGSTDRSGMICDQYALTDKRITVYHKENQGLLHTRRFGIEKAKGEYFVFLDSDDMLTDNALEIIANKITHYHCDCIIYGCKKMENGLLGPETAHTEECCLTDKNEIYKKCLFSIEMNSMCRKVVKASVFHDFDYNIYYGIQLSEDLLQSLEVYKNSESIAFINDKLYIYRTNPNSLTQKNEKIKINFTVRKRVLDFIQKENVFSLDLYNKYRDFCIILLINVIIRIARSDNFEYQRDLFNKIRSDEYYTQFLIQGITDRKYVGYKSIIYDLFKYRFDRLIVIMVKSTMKVKKSDA